MQYTITDENINKSVDYVSEYLETNSVDRKTVKRQTLLMEQLLLLYRENDNAVGFSVKCTRRKARVDVQLCVEAAEHDYLNGEEDPLIAGLLSGVDSAPTRRYRKGCNTITFSARIPIPGIWNLRFLLPYLGKTKGYCALAIFFQTLSIVTNILIPIITAKLIMAYTDDVFTQILFLAVVLTLLSVFNYICSYLSSLFFVKIYNRLLNELETDLSRKIFRLEDACLNKYGAGMFIQRMATDTESVANGFDNITSALSFLVQTLGIIVAVGFISLPLCLFFVFTAALASFLEIRRIKKMAQDDRCFRRGKDRYTGLISEMIRGAKDIRLQNSTESFIGKMSQSIHEANLANYTMAVRSNRRRYLRMSIKELCDLILYAGMALMIHSESLRPAEALIIFNYNLSISSFGGFIGSFFDYINTISVSSERIFQILFSPEFQEEKFGTLCPDGFRGNISFQNVSFAYPQEDLKQPSGRVLNGIDMEIRAGEKIAIVGKSGSGKTTIFNLLTGLYRPSTGKILIDGREYKTLSASYLRSNISAVTQNPYIFNMTVRENLDLAGENISFEEMKNACKAACIYEDIMAMPKQFDTVLGEGGIFLSGGQRQRLAIARCLLRKSRMILLDEATSALDNETQGDVIDKIGKLFSDCTVITAAHRLSTIVSNDRILFLSEGRIMAEGTHAQLLDSCSEYRMLYQNEWMKTAEAEGKDEAASK